eukprot:TRINITY_DN11322_c0_g1_i5.p1 TRINITY_DN11322_c0_g1~~TRINITY_DN11322_c0_g1_i5.p1  ORF type:complete len:147 (-),score=20.76 TRINITY_DN11322_c0_g1_i5:79-519(-)
MSEEGAPPAAKRPRTTKAYVREFKLPTHVQTDERESPPDIIAVVECREDCRLAFHSAVMKQSWILPVFGRDQTNHGSVLIPTRFARGFELLLEYVYGWTSTFRPNDLLQMLSVVLFVGARPISFGDFVETNLDNLEDRCYHIGPVH